MKDAIFGILLGLSIVVVGFAVLSPYYSLLNLKHISEELQKIRELLEKGGDE